MFIQRFVSTGLEKVDESQVEGIFEKNGWHNLVILDSCRHDLYEEIKGETESRYSVGSHSADFIRKTFSDREREDVVLVTANPHYQEKLFKNQTGENVEDVFHEVFHVYRTDWDEDLGTVTPREMIRKFSTARKLFPDKKIILHMMQPHVPFFESSLDLDSSGFYNSGDDSVSEWDHVIEGRISKDQFWSAYREALQQVLQILQENSGVFEGKTVITSDHGNFVGEEGLYDHWEYMNDKVLRKVPWDKTRLN
jgi:hypothetical protein